MHTTSVNTLSSQSAFTGQETCPEWAPEGLREIHINGDIAFAVWQYYRATGDKVCCLCDTVAPRAVLPSGCCDRC